MERLTRKPSRPDHIVIVGAGPAGLTMAHLLRKRGYGNLTILEKALRVGGMTETIWDGANVAGQPDFVPTVPNEMGTCYLSTLRHGKILDLMEDEHVVPLKLSPMMVVNEDGLDQEPFSQWMIRRLKTQFGIDFSPDGFIRAVGRYLELRDRLLGNDDRYLFPSSSPAPDVLAQLAQPFYSFLVDNGLQYLIPLFFQSQTSQGYGYLSEVPTYYGLMWNNDQLFGIPNGPSDLFSAGGLLEAAQGDDRVRLAVERQATRLTEVESHGSSPRVDFRALIPQNGFQSLWERLAARETVCRGVTIRKITRGDAESKPIEIEFTQAGVDCKIVADFLILTAKLDDLGFLDRREDEDELFSRITNYELTTTLFEAKNLPDLPQMFCVDRITEPDLNRCYGTRTSVRCVLPGMELTGPSGPRDVRVAYQITSPTASDREVEERFLEDITRFGATDVQIRERRRWKYMPHFQGESMADGCLWKLWELQGKYRTWYSGSVTCFESTADVYSYNEQLCDYFHL
jgi:oxygen-dependent protoporphyrinogen oxidase